MKLRPPRTQNNQTHLRPKREGNVGRSWCFVDFGHTVNLVQRAQFWKASPVRDNCFNVYVKLKRVFTAVAFWCSRANHLEGHETATKIKKTAQQVHNKTMLRESFLIGLSGGSRCHRHIVRPTAFDGDFCAVCDCLLTLTTIIWKFSFHLHNCVRDFISPYPWRGDSRAASVYVCWLVSLQNFWQSLSQGSYLAFSPL